MMKTSAIHTLRIAALGAVALSISACQAEQPEYEADAEDVSGGELVVSPEDPAEIAVDVPEVEMTMVPTDEAAEAPAE